MRPRRKIQTKVLPPLPKFWKPIIGAELKKPYFKEVERFLDAEMRNYTIFPPRKEIFSALRYTAFEQTQVVILGQDPYHGEHQAHGMCFSVRPGVATPRSLSNIFKELRDDLGLSIPNNGCLIPWARQGVLLLNTILTVRAHEPNSHRSRGWEQFTNAIIQEKMELIDAQRHLVIHSAHPSPHSAYRGFFGSRPFSRINQALRAWGMEEIDWRIPDADKFPPTEMKKRVSSGRPQTNRKE